MTGRDRAAPAVSLRAVTEADLPVFYRDQLDPDAVAMVGFEPRDWDAFRAHWAKIMADPDVLIRTVVVADQVAGNVLSFVHEGEREVGYWIGKRFWGKGVASLALAEFLREHTVRPLYATVAGHNVASIRVLQKCGFSVDDEGRADPGSPEKPVQDVRLRLG
jgi:RimJ/RimL family protein N-acetyltransferase